VNRQEAQELLPWFVAGTLDDAERQAVQAFIDSGEIAAEELAELAFLNESVAAVGVEEPTYDPQILQRALRQLDGVAQAPRADVPDRLSKPDSSSDPAARPQSAPAGVFARMLERLQWSLTPPLARVAIAAQFALLLGLAAALMLSEGPREGTGDGGFEVVAGAVAGDFTIAFTPAATAEQIGQLLRDQHASIVAGPSALGIYTLAVPDRATTEQVLHALQASPVTRFVQRVPRQ